MIKKRVFFWLYLLLKKQLKNPAVLALLIGMPMLALIVSIIPEATQTEKLKVGIVLLDEDEIAVSTRDYLVNGNYSVEFYEASSAKELEEDIIDSKTECGYIFNKNMCENILEGNKAGIFEGIIKDSDFISSMTNEIVFAAMFRAMSLEIAVDFIKDQKDFEPYVSEAENKLRQMYAQYLEGDETFSVDFQVVSKNGVEKDNYETYSVEEDGNPVPIRRILVVMIFVAGLFSTVQYYMDKEKGTFMTLSKRYKISGMPLYALIVSGLFSISVLVTLGILKEMRIDDIWKMPIYVIAVALYAWVIGLIGRSSRGMIVITPILMIMAFVLCPVFVDVAAYFPKAVYLQRLLLPWYMI